MGYNGTYIYILQYNYTFQYLFSLNNEIYRQEINVIPKLWTRILWQLGWVKSPYSQDQIDQAETIVLSGAMKSIEEMKKSGAKKKRTETEKQAKRIDNAGGCMWQARKTADGEGLYLCIIHNKSVAMEENKPPRHD